MKNGTKTKVGINVEELTESELIDTVVYAKTKQFCYDCYEEVIGTHCRQCGSDNLMQLHKPAAKIENMGSSDVFRSKFENDLSGKT